MHPIRPILFVAFLTVHAAAAHAGDPVPDVDVTVEQVPGTGIVLESPTGGFDRLSLSGPRGFVEGLSPDKLPPGWSMSRDGRRAIFSGPAVSGPTRLRLSSERQRPKSVDWDVSYAGRVSARGENVVPRVVPVHRVSNSLSGEVLLPGEVRPGELVTFRPTHPTPPRGTWSLSGVVAEPWDPNELVAALAAAAATRDPRTRSGARGAHGKPPRIELELREDEALACAELAPYIATMQAQQGPLGNHFEVARVAAASPSPGRTHWMTSQTGAALKASHDVAKGAIRNIKALYRIEPVPSNDTSSGTSGGRESVGSVRSAFTIDQKGVKVGTGSQTNATLRTVCGPLGCFDFKPLKPDPPPPMEPVENPDPPLKGGRLAKPAPSGKSFFESRSNTARMAAFRIEPESDDRCAFVPREASDLELARAMRPLSEPSDRAANPLAGEVVYAVELPDDLLPGGALSATLTDLYGDLLIDVPRVPGTTVLPPRAPDEPQPAPCFRAGTVYAQSEQLLCACGSFPTPASWAGILFDERRLADSGGGFGAIVSTSSSVVWFRPPAQTAVGRHFVSGASELGFAPSCKFTTQFLAVSGQIDSERILRGDSTPMRLTIDGSPDPIALRIENLTPGIIDIEGGVDQTLESAGGSPNTLTRQVRGLTRGDFNVRWTLATPACPCEGP